MIGRYRRKTDILDVIARKLAPYMFLFGLYLVSFGDVSPGGGFQGGVVIASGVILLAVARGTSAAAALFPVHRLSVLEAIAYGTFLLAGIAGIIAAGGFLADVFRVGDAVGSPFVFMLNLVIGMKVAAGVSIIFLTLYQGA